LFIRTHTFDKAGAAKALTASGQPVLQNPPK